jgi:hypothetical protein
MKKNTRFESLISSSMTLLLVTTLFSYAEINPEKQPTGGTIMVYEEGKAGMLIIDALTISAKVISVDAPNRKLKLLGPDGEEFEVKVGPQATKFDKIKPLDVITVALSAKLDITVHKNTEGMIADQSASSTLMDSEKPGGMMANTTTITADVIALDHDKHTATLKFKDGNTETYPVRNDVDLNQHEVGEVVIFELTKMIAISVEKPDNKEE